MPTLLAANCTFITLTYTIVLHHLSQSKDSPKSIFFSLYPGQNNSFNGIMSFDSRYNSDFRNASYYVAGSCDFQLAVHNGFSKRYKKTNKQTKTELFFANY